MEKEFSITTCFGDGVSRTVRMDAEDQYAAMLVAVGWAKTERPGKNILSMTVVAGDKNGR